VKMDPKKRGERKPVNKEERKVRVKAIRVAKNAWKRGHKFCKGRVFD